MRILFFSDHLKPEPSAPAAHVFERAKFWVEGGHHVTIMASAPNYPEGKVYAGYKNHWRFVENIEGIRVVRVKTFITRNEGFLLRILDYMSYMISAFFFAQFEPKPDVVISSSPHLFVAIAGVAYAKVRCLPHIFEIRDLWPASILSTNSMKPGRLYRLLERLELFLYRHSARLLSFTQAYVADLASRGVPLEKIDVVMSGANLALFKPQSKKDWQIEREYKLQGRFVIGYLGTLGLAHGLENVIKAAQRLRDSHVTFFFVGVGAAKQALQHMVHEYNVDNVVFAPRQLKEDMPRFWSVCDASLIHLRNAPVFATVIPSKIFESMAMGLPLIYVGPAGEGATLVAQHNAGVVVPPDDAQALACAIQALVADPKQRAFLAANSLAAAPLYSREHQAQATLAVFEKASRSQV